MSGGPSLYPLNNSKPQDTPSGASADERGGLPVARRFLGFLRCDFSGFFD